MYTLLILSALSLFGIFYILTSHEGHVSYSREDLIYHPEKGRLNKSLLTNFFSFVLKSFLTGALFLLNLITPLLEKIQKITGDKLRDMTRKISMGSSAYNKSPDMKSQSSFFRDLAKHKKLVAKRGK